MDLIEKNIDRIEHLINNGCRIIKIFSKTKGKKNGPHGYRQSNPNALDYIFDDFYAIDEYSIIAKIEKHKRPTFIVSIVAGKIKDIILF